MTDAPIGIFDSGVGGLTVARAIRDQLPNESLLYVGDTAHSPYGPKSIADVRRYSLEVLDFLPIDTVDPFSGVITTGFGTPPGGGRPYRATVHISDAALDARSLNLALLTSSGPASAETVRAVENAILNRARQIRIRDRGL